MPPPEKQCMEITRIFLQTFENSIFEQNWSY